MKTYKRACKEHDMSNCITCAKIRADKKFAKINKNSEDLTKKRKESNLSKGELEVARVLEYLNLPYEREKHFTGLYNHNGKTLLYYDFWIPCKNLCIEFDGSQHYSINKKESEKINDFKKTIFCKKMSMNILRIKYTDIDKIELLISERLDLIKDKIIEDKLDLYK